MPFAEPTTPRRLDPEELLDATVRQLEALTALAATSTVGRKLEELFESLADKITRLTDYRTCLVVLFSDESPYFPRIVSFSANVPSEYVSKLGAESFPRDGILKLVDKGKRIEVGELGFAAYYPPTHYHLLDATVPNRLKVELERFLPDDESPAWHEGDELFVPMMTHEGEFLGLISLDDPRSGRAPDRESVLPAVAFARQAAQVVARHRDAGLLAEQADREALINRITRAVRQSLDPSEVFRAAVGELGLHLGVDRCVLYMLDPVMGIARNFAEYVAPGSKAAGREYDIDRISGIVDKIRLHGYIAFEDVANDERIREFYDGVLSKLGTRSVMYVGIRVGNDMPAAFAISMSRETRRWRDSDVALARAVADQTGIAIRQAELFQRSEAAGARQALVNRLSHGIRATLDISEVMNTATHELGQALDASRVYLRSYDPTRPDDSLALYEYIAPGCKSIGSLTISFNYPVGQLLMTELRTLVVHDAINHNSDDQALNEHLLMLAERGGATRSMVFCPLVVQGRFRGALVIHQTDRVRRWEREEIALIEAVASQLATGVAQAELFELVARAKRTWEVTFDAMSDGIFIFSNDRRLVRVNRSGAALEAVHAHDLVGQHCCDILRAEGIEGCIIERVTAEKRPLTLEYTPEKLGRPLLLTAEPLSDVRGQIGTVCTVRDLTELRRVETLARERQSLLENVLESAREAICALSPEGNIMWCNRAATMMSGYSQNELIGKQIFELAEESESESIRDCFGRALEGRPQTVETRFVTRAGEVRYAVSDTAPMVIDGKTVGVLLISRDITDQKQERERAVQADKLRALGQLASGVAHDFNNALAAILGRAQLLRRATRDAEVLRGLDIIETAAGEAAATVRRIRTFAQQSPGETFRVLDIHELLGDAVEITRTRWENEARARGLTYEVRLSTEAPLRVYGNPSELREVFVNLIVNAIDAMPDGGELLIKSTRPGGRLRVTFADTGTGINDEVRERIFEPFYTTKGVYGTGLGLFVSYGIIERHGGSIEVESIAGKGTTFTIDLPESGRFERRGDEMEVPKRTSQQNFRS